MENVINNVYRIVQYGFVNYYIIDTSAGLILIDAGVNKASINRLGKSLKAKNFTLDDIKHILITHAHPDHIGGLQALQERISAPTYIHQLDAPVLRGDEPAQFAPDDTVKGLAKIMQRQMKKTEFPTARVDHELVDGDDLNHIMPGLTVVHLPGHSNGQCGYFLNDSRVLIAGDVMMNFPFGMGLRKPLYTVSPDWNAVKDSIRKVAAMDINVLCLGHGAPILGKADQAVDQFAQKLK